MRFKKEFDFVGVSKYFYSFSIILTIVGFISLGVFGLNYGVDFKAGSNVDISTSKALTSAEILPILDEIGIGEDASITPGEQRTNIRFTELLDEEHDHALKAAILKLDETASFEINTVDTEMAKELGRNAIYAVLLSCIGIIIYVGIRFEWRFAMAAILALLHDAFLVITIFSIFQLEVDLIFITAVLTIIGYSINDTIVIFDRIRENLRFSKTKTHDDLVVVVNKSVNQMILRSLYTALTVFIAAFFLFIFGGESIRMFSLAMVIGLIFGAYSSIFIASPFWVLLKSKQKNQKTSNPSKA
ncbi:SecD/SecF fusion protein [Paenibacillus sp. DS2015]|uniref:protein translocase subunit SecF n=1 Tax=Paenibacillus sp. DS2015 TaxID=3373917 RepID=UPI003D232198